MMLKSFSFFERAQALSHMNEDLVYDLVIIGGGINGAGVARDAAQRGLKVLLLEKSDFASGTSSRSSKLIHGGIRYLENLEFKLVFEALSERSKLFEMAPHLVHPLRFLIPLYKGGRVQPLMMGLGMWLYDALSLFQAPELNEYLSATKALQQYENLRGQDLLGSFRYSDAYMDDDRLTIETLRSANDDGATAINYAKVSKVTHLSQRLFQVQFEDVLSGVTKSVKAKHLVSCLGPWTDIFWQAQTKEKFLPQPILRPTKGIHLTLSQERFPLRSAVVMAAEKRIVFAIPRHDMVIIGTTDTDYAGDPGRVRVENEDVEYIIQVLQNYFPKANIQRSDFISGYAGVRPLVADGSASEGKTSREHTIFTRDGITFVAGGKYTTYRLMSEQIVDACLKEFSIEEKSKWRRSQTHLPMNPLVDVETMQMNHLWVQHLRRMTRLPLSEIEFLVSRYGKEVTTFEIPSKDQTLWQIEARQAIRNTMCLSLVDFMTRRTPLFLSSPDHGIFHLPQIMRVFSEELKWSSAQQEQERKGYLEYIQNELHWKNDNAKR